MKPLLTREDYMKDGSNLHQAYYSQFITPRTIAFIKANVTLKRLRASTDRHLNDIVKTSSGPNGSWFWDNTPFNIDKAQAAREVSNGCSGSKNTRTFIGKACAKMLMDTTVGEDYDI